MSDPSGVPSVEDLLKAHGTYIAGRGLTCVCKCEEVLGESGGRSSIGMSNLHRAHLAAVLSAREALVLAEGRAEAGREMTTLAEAAVIEAERAAHREQDRIERSLNLVHILGEPGVSLERVARFIAWADVHAEDQREITARVILAALRHRSSESEDR